MFPIEINPFLIWYTYFFLFNQCVVKNQRNVMQKLSERIIFEPIKTLELFIVH